MELRGTVVAITGAARGIGRATARAFLDEGARVAIGDLDSAVAEQTAARLGPPERVRAWPLDVTDRSSFTAFLDAAEEHFGPIDVLVNNAGIMIVGELTKEPDRVTDLQLDVNVRGVLLGSKLAAGRMLERSRGHIVNVASAAGKIPLPRLVTYVATKHAVVGLSAALRLELRSTGVGVSVVMPVPTATRLGAALGSSIVPQQQPEDVARAIVHCVRRGTPERFVPSWLEIVHASVRWLPARAREAMSRLLGGEKVMLDARDDERVNYETEALRQQVSRRASGRPGARSS